MKKTLSLFVIITIFWGTITASYADNGSWLCSNGHENAAENRYCGKCGEKKTFWECSNGHKNLMENQFCTVCGKKKTGEIIVDLSAFSAASSKVEIDKMLEELSVEESSYIEYEGPWNTGTTWHFSVIIPITEEQKVIKVLDKELNIDITGSTVEILFIFDANELLQSTMMRCTINDSNLELPDIKDLFFRTFKTLGLKKDPDVKLNKLDPVMYFANEVIENTSITVSLQGNKFSIGI